MDKFDEYFLGAVFTFSMTFLVGAIIFGTFADIREKDCIVTLIGQDIPASEAKLVCKRR